MDLSSVQLFLLALPVLSSEVIARATSDLVSNIWMTRKKQHLSARFFYLNVGISVNIMYEIVFMPFVRK